MSGKHKVRALFGFLLLLYWLVSLRHLAVVPPVYEDEPWQASTGWKIAREGVFGSDLFTGFYGMERHYYGYMPVHPLLLAAVFRGAGVGLFQARFEPAVLGALALALTAALGRRLFGPAVGLLAVYFLLAVRLTALGPSQVTGIVLLDFARIARYDMAVPVLGLAALHVYWPAARAGPERPASLWRYALAGLLAGLATLSHLYGAFWLVALAVLTLWQRAGWQQLLALASGFALPWLPYALYVFSGLPDWIGQTRDYAPRFGLLEPGWYWQNLLQEPRRYGPGLGPPGWNYLLRPGFWAALGAVPLALLALGRRALAGDRAARTLFVPAVALPALLALLIYLKLANYLVTIVPLWAVAVAWGARQALAWRPLARALLVLLLLAISAEGAWRLARLEQAAATTTPYADFMAQVEEHIPAGATVLGLHHYWFGLEDRAYRSWAVPLLQGNATYWSPPRPVGLSLEVINPEVVLIDRRMRAFFEGDPETAGAIWAWLDERGFRPAAVVEDRTYGRMEIYRR
ncbi:MAG: hypothetical protein L0332_11815 [Chloroflexi bacterium]|nr:hypothetical protein [Chloroflexota bacterium]MCI0576684.1 hypothetical protein [Chloroflexota bacterium]MCI0647997.1 hypothetical protein [Chloroflexota bacterium]MCI0727396.1 hypothetical protein [Chloroflexota bacterium]